MSLLQAIESRIAALVEGTFGRLFRAQVQPVEIARKLVREMDSHQQKTLRSIYVPGSYEVYLSPADHENLAANASVLTNELSAYLAEHARRAGYSLRTHPRVSLHRDPDLSLGFFAIAVRSDGEEPAAAPAVVPAPVAAAEPTTVQPAVVAAPRRFVLVAPGGVCELGEGRVTIGRGKGSDLQVDDPGVSRTHAEVSCEAGAYVVRDLGSTNGVVVNGTKVQEHRLQDGDVLQLGGCAVRFEPAPPGGSVP